jgi:excisionase family DNA binding protein
VSVFDFDEQALRSLISDEIRRALREELRQKPGGPGEFVSVGEAASITSVTPQTIRVWLQQRRLKTYRAGRELRVRRSELLDLLARGATAEDTGTDLTPEQLADRQFESHRQRTRARRHERTIPEEANKLSDETVTEGKPKSRNA